MSNSRQGLEPWNKGVSVLSGPKHHSVETRLKMSKARKAYYEQKQHQNGK